LGSKRLRLPPKIPRNVPLCVLPQTKKILLHFQIQRYIGIFISQREREREREERERERKRERTRARASVRAKARKRKEKRKRKGKRANKRAGVYVSKLPGPE
jgi:hypothetical protein